MSNDVLDVDLLHLLDEPVVGLDYAGHYRFVNRAATRIKGLAEDQLLGNKLWEVFPEAFGSLLHRECKRAEVERTHIRFEGFFSPLESWFEVHLYPSPEILWLIFRDITSRKTAELALIGSEQRYRRLFEDVPVALYRTSPDGILLDVNAALVDMLAYPDHATFMRVNAADVYVDPADRLKWQSLLETNPDCAVYEMRDYRFDGSIIWVRDTASAVRDASGRIQYYQGTLEDITQRKEAEDALRESEARFRLLAAASDDVIWDWDITSGEVRWNEALRTVFGFSPQDVGPGIEHSYAWWIAHIHEEDRARIANELHLVVRGDSHEWASEYRFRRLDGSFARVIDRCYIGRNEAGAATRIIGSMLDLDRNFGRSRHDLSAASIAPTLPPVPITSDATLMRWITNRNERAFEDLYARHAAFVFAVAGPLLMDPAETDEVVADVFLHVWKNAAQFDASRGTVSAWIANIARARALDRIRKTDRRQRLAAEKSPPASTSQGIDPGFDPDLEAMLDRSLGLLSAPQRRVIEMAYFHGMTHAEIALRLKEPLGTVKTRLRAALERMRRDMAPPG